MSEIGYLSALLDQYESRFGSKFPELDLVDLPIEQAIEIVTDAVASDYPYDRR